jgi:D-alanyl-D-alanine endopeptidase (penicillin-binding protein 7)
MQRQLFYLFLFLLPLLCTNSSYVHASKAASSKHKPLWLRSHAALIVNQNSNKVLYEKHADQAMPIASITKLMTAMIVLDGKLDMAKIITIADEDKDRLRYSRSRLAIGSRLSRHDLLKMALMASENRAAAALARTWPGGRQAFVTAMNSKAKALGMTQTRLVDSTGLHAENTSTARDLALLLKAAWKYDLIRDLCSQGESSVMLVNKNQELEFLNTNRLLRRSHWQIGMSKTGYIKESGRCLVMQTTIAGRDLFIILLNAQGKLSSFGDSGRIRRWLENQDSTKNASADPGASSQPVALLEPAGN